MRGRALSLLFLVAILFSAFGTASSGATEAVMASHGSEIIASMGHVEGADHDRHDPAGDAPCQATAHHHCSIAVAVEASPLSPAFAFRDPKLSPISASALASLSQPPPTQPPAA